MTDEWSLQDEILDATHRWPLIVLFCLVGSLLGWGVSMIWPSPYRATKELYIGLNLYQVPSQEGIVGMTNLQFNNIDDYKNWQMANLNSLVFMQEILDETLQRLRQADNNWSTVTRSELEDMLDVYWRNAGKWRLVAETDDQQRAIQAVTIWQDVVIERVQGAIDQARETIALDTQMKSTTAAQAQAISRLAELTLIHQSIQRQRAAIASLPADLPVEENLRWTTWEPLSQAGLGQAWTILNESFPSPEKPAQDYLPWLDRALQLLDHETRILNAQIQELEKNKQQTVADYSIATQASLGISANLQVGRLNNDPPQHSLVRPTGLFMLVGAALGLIAWLFTWLASITRRVRV